MSTIFRDFPYNFFMVIFSTRLKELRKFRNLSQKELATVLNTNNSSICDWECGRAQPDLETIAKLSIIFDVSADYLLGLEDETGAKTYNNKYNIGTLNNNGKIDMK